MSSGCASGPRPRARRAGLVIEEMGGELLIYDLERDRAHALNESAALVFRHCDGRRGVGELTAALGEMTGAPVDEVVALRALQRLDDAHLLEAPAAEGRQWSRREALRRIGMAGAAAGLAVPVVRSIVVPTAAEAQASCTPELGVCGTVSTPTGCVPTGPACCAGLFCQGPAVDGAICTCQM
jgi:coenzyme PQQ synthesis protein D (PqqD)